MLTMIAAGILLNMHAMTGPQGENVLIVLLMPLILGSAGFLFAWRRMAGLADDVFDAGDRLLFRWRGGREQQVELRDIMRLRYLQYSSPQRITVNLRDGDSLSFVPAKKFGAALRPWAPNPLVEELIGRIRTAHANIAPAPAPGTGT
jgi:hypothetical protein